MRMFRGSFASHVTIHECNTCQLSQRDATEELLGQVSHSPGGSLSSLARDIVCARICEFVTIHNSLITRSSPPGPEYRRVFSEFLQARCLQVRL
jgi:hypothetical protein